VSPVKYELGFCITEDGILHSHRRENLNSYMLSIYLNTLRFICYVRFEFITAVTMKNGVFWDVTPCGSCKNRHCVLRLLVNDDVLSSSLTLSS
jgi:hypothetical protein